VTINSSQIDDPSLDVIWSLLDYGWLSDQARPSTLEDTSLSDLAQTSTGDGALDAGLMAQTYDLVGDFDIDPSITVQDQISLDYLAFAENSGDAWPVVEGDMNFSNELVLPSPWTPHFVE
jgi:hypothetical protein